MGPDVLYQLKLALYECEDYLSVEILNSNEIESVNELLPIQTIDITGNASRRSAEQDPSESEPSGVQAIDGSLISKIKKAESHPEKHVEVKTTDIMAQGDLIYPMTKSPRGICLIINNILFSQKMFEPRLSAQQDGPYLESIFKQLDFNVTYYEDMSILKMKDLFHQTAKNNSLKEHQAFVCIVMSHGIHDDHVIGSDGNFIRTENIFKYFNNSNCPNLIGKPKIFFIQACRGGKSPTFFLQ